MPVRYWMLVIALGGCLISLNAIALTPGGEYYERRQVEDTPAIEQDPPPPPALSVVCVDVPLTESGSKNDREQEETARYHNSDLCQQWRMAQASDEMTEWSARQTYVTGFEAFLLAITIVVAYWAGTWAKRAAIAGDETVKVTRDATSRQLRAYIHVSDCKIQNFGPKSTYKASVTIKNFGQTPAYNVHLIYWTEVKSAKFLKIDIVREIFRHRFTRKSGVLAGTIGPTEEFNVPIGRGSPPHIIQASLINAEIYQAFVFGIVIYRDAFKRLRTTQFQYMTIMLPNLNRGYDTVPCEKGNTAT